MAIYGIPGNMASLEVERGVITNSYDSYCDIIDSMVMLMHLWGTDGNLLLHLWGFEYFGAYLQG